MAGAIDVLNVARSQIGFTEGANNENPYGIWYGIPDAPYCAMGVSWCFAQVGLSHLIAAQTPKGFSFNPVALTWFQSQGLVVGKYSGQPGDLVFFDWNRDGVVDHVEIIEAVSPDGITTIGFNTGNPNDPVKEGCWQLHRNYLFVAAIVRPKYPTVIVPPVNSTSKKTTAAVATGATAVAGGAMAMHPSTPAQIQSTVKATTSFVAPPFPVSKTAFNIGQQNGAVLTIELALAKAGLLPPQYETGIMNKQTQVALTKWEAKEGIKATGVPQIVYDTLKGSL
jgi:CHAP domain